MDKKAPDTPQVVASRSAASAKRIKVSLIKAHGTGNEWMDE